MSIDDRIDPLPPLEWLHAFEAAGRLGNFTGAARELGLTQAAVSQRIRHLEVRLNTRLFLRLARGVELTTDGETYLPHVKNALDALRRGTADLFASPRTKITIAAPASVAALWLAPRIRRLNSKRPLLQISILAVHRQSDFEAAQADLEVRFGNGDWPELDSAQLYEETLVPSCTKTLLGNAPAGDWRRLPIIAVSGPRDGWHEWATASGEAPLNQPLLRFDSLIAAQYAALAGAGVFLASGVLARSAFRSGDLVELSNSPLVMNAGYWLTWPRGKILYADDEAIISTLTSDH